MGTQILYFNDEMLLKLKKEENMSKLINELLINHYKEKSLTEEQIIEEVKRRIAAREERERREKEAGIR